MASVERGRGRGNLGAREHVGHTREKDTPHMLSHAQIPPSPSPFKPLATQATELFLSDP